MRELFFVEIEVTWNLIDKKVEYPKSVNSFKTAIDNLWRAPPTWRPNTDKQHGFHFTVKPVARASQ